ncbi:MAG: hypothetical protein WC108_07265 [Bacteroidales bacterium]
MRNENRIFTIAFEGESRSGKGTQIEMIKNKLKEIGIPCIDIQGDGYRNGSGTSEKDPKSDYWQKISEILKNNPDNYLLWNKASYRLARELIVWRDRILSREVAKSLQPFGVLLVDRSLISNSVLKILEREPQPGVEFNSSELYPDSIQDRKKITTSMILPDMIIELIAPKEILLSRLDKNNSEYSFKKDSIENKYELYLEAKKRLPQEIQNIVISIDSSKSQEEVFTEVAKQIKSKFPEIKINVN